jgi:hypothetical protein
MPVSVFSGGRQLNLALEITGGFGIVTRLSHQVLSYLVRVGIR